MNNYVAKAIEMYKWVMNLLFVDVYPPTKVDPPKQKVTYGEPVNLPLEVIIAHHQAVADEAQIIKLKRDVRFINERVLNLQRSQQALRLQHGIGIMP